MHSKPINFEKPKVIDSIAKKNPTMILMVSCHLREIYQQGWKCFN